MHINPTVRQVIASPTITNRREEFSFSPDEEVEVLPLLPGEAVDMLRGMILTNEPDRLVWDLTPSGEFSTSSFWNQRRHRNVNYKWSEFFWNKYIPPKVVPLASHPQRHPFGFEDHIYGHCISLPM